MVGKTEGQARWREQTIWIFEQLWHVGQQMVQTGAEAEGESGLGVGVLGSSDRHEALSIVHRRENLSLS